MKKTEKVQSPSEKRLEIVKYVIIVVLAVLLCLSVASNIDTYTNYFAIKNYNSYLVNLNKIRYQKGMDEVYNINNDFVAWIECADVNLALPVVKTSTVEDEEFYFNHSFKKEKNMLGTPYQKSICDLGSSDNTIFSCTSGYDQSILGSSSSNSLFSKFSKYLEIDDNFDYNIGIHTLNSEYLSFEIVSIYKYNGQNNTTKQTHALTTATIETQEQFDTFYQNITDLSEINTNNTATFGDEFLTVVARLDANFNLVIVAKQI